MVSRSPLGKAPTVPSFEDRIAVLEEVAEGRDWLSLKVTDRRLIAEVGAGYDAVVMGLDKWLQVVDPAWYGGSEADRDEAVASLPRVLLALRGEARRAPRLPPGALVLDVPAGHLPISSSLARGSRTEWMLPEAARFDARTGAWSDPERYRRGCRGSGGPGH